MPVPASRALHLHCLTRYLHFEAETFSLLTSDPDPVCLCVSQGFVLPASMGDPADADMYGDSTFDENFLEDNDVVVIVSDETIAELAQADEFEQVSLLGKKGRSPAQTGARSSPRGSPEKRSKALSDYHFTSGSRFESLLDAVGDGGAGAVGDSASLASAVVLPECAVGDSASPTYAVVLPERAVGASASPASAVVLPECAVGASRRASASPASAVVLPECAVGASASPASAVVLPERAVGASASPASAVALPERAVGAFAGLASVTAPPGGASASPAIAAAPPDPDRTVGASASPAIPAAPPDSAMSGTSSPAIAATPSDSPVGTYRDDLGSQFNSPKATRTVAQMIPPGTDEQTRMADETAARVLRAERRILDLEAALHDTEEALRKANEELEFGQMNSEDPVPDLENYYSGGSRPSSPEPEDEAVGNQPNKPEGGTEGGTGSDAAAAAGSGAPTITTAFSVLMGSYAKRDAEERAQAEHQAAQQAAQCMEREAYTARRKAVADLKLPTEQQPSSSTIDWDQERFLDAERKTQQRRSVRISASAKHVKLRKGKHGWRHNSRQGLIGAVRYWAAGSRSNVVKMLLGLIEEFDVAEDIRKVLFLKARRQAETDTFIVNQLVAVLEILKGCKSEQQRREFRLLLASVAPPRADEGDVHGMARRVAARLCVRRGRRSLKQGGRPFAFDGSMDQRKTFDLAAAKFRVPAGPLQPGQQRSLVAEPLQPGERVLTQNNGEAELARFTPNGGCVLIFRVGDVFKEVTFTVCFGKGKGSAGLRRIPPTLVAPLRVIRCDAISYATRKAIHDHIATVAPTSPHTRDVMRRRVGPFLVEEKPAFIQSDTEEALFELFRKAEPDVKIQLAQYKKELPWNMKKAYRSTCLDRCEVNFDWHRQGLGVAMEILAPLLSPSTEDAEGEDEAEARPTDPLLQELAQFAQLTSRTEIGNQLVCMPALVAPGDERLGDSTAQCCLDGQCRCGFKRFWSNGLRPKYLQRNEDGTETLRDGVSPLWGRQMSWDTIKPGGDGNGDSAEDSDLRHTVSGTVHEFLDACESVHYGWVPHRFHGVQSKKAEKESERNLTPCKLKNDSDWSENGEIVVKMQMQSEYWSIKHYSLLISITSFLVSVAWIDRKLPLKAGAEVTVQPADAPIYSVAYVKGSYFGVVVEGSTTVGRDVAYTVKRPDGSTATLPRHQLRHRVWHRVAFLGVTNEKQHVAVTTQAFFSRQLEFWRIWKEEGRLAALAFAANDRAAVGSTTGGIDAANAAAAAADAEAETREAVEAETEMEVEAEGEADAEMEAEAAADDGDVAAAATAATGPVRPAWQAQAEAEAAAVENHADADVAAAAAAASVAATARPSHAAAIAATIARSDPTFAQFLAELDYEKFWAWVGHSDNATHFKSSGNLYWWSCQLDTLGFIRSIWQQYGCPGKGKGPWDGLGAVVKTKVRSRHPASHRPASHCPAQPSSPPLSPPPSPPPPPPSPPPSSLPSLCAPPAGTASVHPAAEPVVITGRYGTTSPTASAALRAGGSALHWRWPSTCAPSLRAPIGW